MCFAPFLIHAFDILSECTDPSFVQTVSSGNGMVCSYVAVVHKSIMVVLSMSSFAVNFVCFAHATKILWLWDCWVTFGSEHYGSPLWLAWMRLSQHLFFCFGICKPHPIVGIPPSMMSCDFFNCPDWSLFFELLFSHWNSTPFDTAQFYCHVIRLEVIPLPSLKITADRTVASLATTWETLHAERCILFKFNIGFVSGCWWHLLDFIHFTACHEVNCFLAPRFVPGVIWKTDLFKDTSSEMKVYIHVSLILEDCRGMQDKMYRRPILVVKSSPKNDILCTADLCLGYLLIECKYGCVSRKYRLTDPVIDSSSKS